MELELDGAVLLADPAHVERILENFLINATKHTPPGTRIWVRTEEASPATMLIVEDAGPGVPPELRTSIFEPFRQGDTPSHAPGTGIGLSLVSRFAHLNGGRAWLEDRPGGGASFRVLLPVPGRRAFPPARRLARRSVRLPSRPARRGAYRIGDTREDRADHDE